MKGLYLRWKGRVSYLFLEKVVKGDEAAFRLLFETYSRRLFHVAYYYPELS